MRIETKIESLLEGFGKKREERLKELRRARSELEDGPVVISMLNWGYRDMLANWVASCDRAAIDCRAFTLLFPTDEQADVFARKLGLRTYFDGESYGQLPIEASKVFGDSDFRLILFAKIAMTVDMVGVGGDLIRQDVDMIWRRDPRADLLRRVEREGFDMLFMYDGPNKFHRPLHYNSGFVFIRSNPFTRQMWETVLSNYPRIVSEGGEQQFINVIVNSLHAQGLRTERLPEETYVNGHLICRALDSGGKLPEESAVVHASWTTNIDMKIERFRQFDLWHL